MLAISREVILGELIQARSWLDKWIQIVEAGVPGIDIPVTGMIEDGSEQFVRGLCAELRIIAGKCDNLATVVMDTSQE